MRAALSVARTRQAMVGAGEAADARLGAAAAPAEAGRAAPTTAVRRPAGARAPGPRAREPLACATALLLLLLWDASGVDLPLVRLFGGPDGFAWRHRLLTALVLHEGGRLCSAALLTLTLVAAARPFGPWRELARTERLWWVAVTVGCLLAVAALKRHSPTSCPWSLQEFGGHAVYLSHWGWRPDGGPGHCFPSGHASGAFAFLAIGVVLRAREPCLARAWTIGLVTLGALFGLAQTMRGAHYPSHSFYTAWLCWALTLASHRALRSGRPPTGAPACAEAEPTRVARPGAPDAPRGSPVSRPCGTSG
jgi:membrane-associated PAP2 superfamily phosphatase